jgi:hypothetical protein
LTKEQQKLVYKEESRAKLEAEPVEITLGEVTIPLEHLDRNRLPNRFKTFRKIIAESETKEDWENVVRCLEGFEEAGIKVPSAWQELAIRKLNLAGMHHLILKILQRPKETGVRLSNLTVLRQVLRSIHDKATLADWAEDETAKAYKLAKQVVELMDDEEHHKSQKRDLKDREVVRGDWRGRPAVVALPTEMAAMLAQRYGGDKEEVKKLSARLVNALKQSAYMVGYPTLLLETQTHANKPLQTSLDLTSQRSGVTSAAHVNVTKQLTFLQEYSYDLLEVLIVWNALKASRKVLGAEMPMTEEAQKFEARANEVLMQGLGSLENMSKNKEGKPLKDGTKDYIEKSAAMTFGQ